MLLWFVGLTVEFVDGVLYVCCSSVSVIAVMVEVYFWVVVVVVVVVVVSRPQWDFTAAVVVVDFMDGRRRRMSQDWRCAGERSE